MNNEDEYTVDENKKIVPEYLLPEALQKVAKRLAREGRLKWCLWDLIYEMYVVEDTDNKKYWD